MGVTNAIELFKMLQQKMIDYQREYDQYINHNLLGDEQRKKPIGKFIKDLRSSEDEVLVESKKLSFQQLQS
jgi:hypothetical protein